MKRLICFLFVTLLVCSANAQDRNLLAKIAYEDAETALTKGDYMTAHYELQKVDSLLGKLTPKSQYLRVQMWMAAKQQTPGDQNINGAITACQTYLDLGKSFELPEDKMMEVARLFVNLKKEKEAVALQKQQQAANAAKQEAESKKREADFKAFESFIEQKTGLKRGMSLEQVKAARAGVPMLCHKVASGWYRLVNLGSGNDQVRKVRYSEGIIEMTFDNNQLRTYDECVYWSKNVEEAKKVRDKYIAELTQATSQLSYTSTDKLYTEYEVKLATFENRAAVHVIVTFGNN